MACPDPHQVVASAVAAPVVVAVATRAEARLVPSNAATLRIALVGPALAARSQLAGLRHGAAPAGLVSLGFAGGLDPALPAGTIIVARSVRRESSAIFPTHPQWRAQVLQALDGHSSCGERDLLAVERLVRSPAEKRQLWRATGAAAVDLESGELAATAAEMSIPFLVLRAVLDDAGDALPSRSETLLTPAGGARISQVAFTALRDPRASWRLLSSYRVAAAALQRALQQVLPLLATPPAATDAPAAAHPGLRQTD
jgi:adenosylhomocysteine nucleosidase